MKEIITKKGYKILVDDIDFDILNKYTWHLGTRMVRNAKMRISIHRFIFKNLMNKEIPPNMQIDHKNRNVLDNRRTNLRLATPSQNNANRLMVNAKSGFPGVRKYRGKWRADIQINGKKKFIGMFKSRQEAYRRYVDYSINLFGNFSAVKN